MFESSFDFGKFADFLGYFADKFLKMIFQTKEWLEKTADSLK